MLSITQHPGRYVASLAAVLAVAGGVLAAGPAVAAPAPARAGAAAADLRAVSTAGGPTSTNSGTISDAGGVNSPTGPTSRLQKGTPAPPPLGCLYATVPCGPPAIQATWQNDFNDEAGTITVSGSGFTPGDKITVTISDGQIPTPTLTPTASLGEPVNLGGIPALFGRGRFTVSLPGIGCASNEGFADQISAWDPQNGDVAYATVVTPCAG